MLCLARSWQLNHGRHLDGILVCGDLGFFPDLSKLDKATKRFAKVDPEELGVAKYFRKPEPEQRDPYVEQTFKGSPDALSSVLCPIVWCNGNHEDFDALASIVGSQDLCPVDCYDRFSYLRNGAVTEVAGVAVAAVGGAPENDGRGDDPRRYVSESACLEVVGKDYAVLLGHGSARGLGGESENWGSDLLRDLVETTQPLFFFFAHHKTPMEARTIGRTHCHWLNDVAFQFKDGRPKGQLEPGCMGILEWGETEQTFDLIREPWFYGITTQSWLTIS